MIEIITISIAFLSLIVAYRGIRLTADESEKNRLYNTKMVKPAIDLLNTKNSNGFSISLINQGLGPAYVDHIDLWYGDKKIEFIEDYHKLLKPDLEDGVLYKYSWLEPRPMWISTGGEKILIHIEYEEDYFPKIKDFKLKFTFQDLYDNEFKSVDNLISFKMLSLNDWPTVGKSIGEKVD